MLRFRLIKTALYRRFRRPKSSTASKRFLLGEVGPQLWRDVHLRVGKLPGEKGREAHFARRANEQSLLVPELHLGAPTCYHRRRVLLRQAEHHQKPMNKNRDARITMRELLTDLADARAALSKALDRFDQFPGRSKKGARRMDDLIKAMRIIQKSLFDLPRDWEESTWFKADEHLSILRELENQIRKRELESLQ